MSVVLVLVWPWREGEVHQVRDGGLPLAAVWILHAENLSVCILIQGSELLALLVLGLACLDVSGGGGGASVSATASARPALAAVVGEELLGLRLGRAGEARRGRRAGGRGGGSLGGERGWLARHHCIQGRGIRVLV